MILLISFGFKISYSQTIIKGNILNDNKEAIPFASVVVKKDSLSSIIDYSYSDENGSYKLMIEKEGIYNLSFSSLGYDAKVVKIQIKKAQEEITRDIILEDKPLSLNEVIITPEKPIRVKKDTIVFNAKYFRVGNEQTVEDLLKKIPGLSIDNNGTIKVGNKEIEKLMVDGDDLFEKGYKILSKNMPPHPIDKVEILNNYSNNRLLSGVEQSDKVALNLKLKDKFKRIWFGNFNLGYGIVSENRYDSRFNLANFGKKNKFFSIGSFNNVGYDATGDIENLVHPLSDGDEPGNIGDNQNTSAMLNLSSDNLDFEKSRTHFNNEELVSLNAIFNPIEKLKIKTLAFLNWDETSFFKNSLNVVSANSTNFTNTESYKLRNKSKIAFLKLGVVNNISKTQVLEADTKYNNGNFNNSANLVFNENSTIEDLQHQNTLFDQKITYTNKFRDRKVLLLTGRFIKEETPQNYFVNQFFYQGLFPLATNANSVGQQSTNKMKFIGTSAHLLNRKENEHLFELQLGNELRIDKLLTSLSLLEDNMIIDRPNGYQNQSSYQVNNLYLKSKYRLQIDNLGIVGKLNAHQLFNRLDNNNSVNHQTPFFINPSLGFDWEINNNNKITSSFSYNTTNAKILEVFSDFVLTGFRSFSKGTGTFNQLDASNLVFNYQLGNWNNRFFANTFIVYTKNHDFLSTNTTIDQNFLQAENIKVKNREFVSINTKLDYYLKFISSNLKVVSGYSKSEFKNIVNNSDLRQVTSNNYNFGIELRSGFKGVFNYHVGTKWITTEIETTQDNSFTNNESFLDVSFIFNKKLQFNLQSELYYFGSLQTDKTYCFLDFDTRYKLLGDKLIFGLTGKNLFDTQKFTSLSISDIGTSTAEYSLLPRFVLLKLEYRF